jgi:hypothetical protein
LPKWNIGEQTVEPIRSRLAHASADARGAHAAALARERDAQLVTASGAAKTQEAVLEVGAAQQALQLGGDEPRQRRTVVLNAWRRTVANDLRRSHSSGARCSPRARADAPPVGHLPTSAVFDGEADLMEKDAVAMRPSCRALDPAGGRRCRGLRVSTRNRSRMQGRHERCIEPRMLARHWIGLVVSALTAIGCDGTDADGSGDGSETGDACEACGDNPCRLPAPEGDCLGPDVLCVPPASSTCETCMADACGNWTGRDCSGFDCIDFAVAIGGCGDATPYAEAYDCMAANCLMECNPGADFTDCSCI